MNKRNKIIRYRGQMHEQRTKNMWQYGEQLVRLATVSEGEDSEQLVEGI